jgi:hypothetical protein
MELTKEKYESIVKLLQNHDESIKNLKSSVKESNKRIEELQSILATSIHIIMMDNACLASMLLSIIEVASNEKTMDIGSIKEKFILNMDQNKQMMQDFAESDDIDEAIDQYTAFFEMLESEQVLADKLNTKNKGLTKTINNESKVTCTSKKSLSKKPLANDTVNKKSSNIIHFDFKGDNK